MGIDQIKRAIFLDRDGIINSSVVKEGKPYPPASVVEVQFITGVRECLLKFAKKGFLIFIITNQPDVARGTKNIEEIEKIHHLIKEQFPVDEIFACYHDDEDHCTCRKPGIGFFLQAQRDYAIDLTQSYMVGDRWRDIDAGKNAGCTTIFVDYGYNEKLKQQPDFIIQEPAEMIQYIK